MHLNTGWLLLFNRNTNVNGSLKQKHYYHDETVMKTTDLYHEMLVNPHKTYTLDFNMTVNY